MRTFEIPQFYRSPLISRIKLARKQADGMKKDFRPTVLDFGTIRFVLARHFGFCYGVENAIEIIYRALEENPDKRVFLLSQMIHNPEVNADLESRGVRFLFSTSGAEITPMAVLQPEDVVVVPAFGTTLELERELTALGVDLARYDTTCPFVEKVWKRSAKLGESAHTVIIHGKPEHEETRATFSHAAASAPALVIRDMEETERLCAFLEGRRPWSAFFEEFPDRTSPGFQPELHLQRVGVVNQTTMLATETVAISDRIRRALEFWAQSEPGGKDFANTRDTLCYATLDNQQATEGALAHAAPDWAVVVGGYNSSNTSHLVELIESIAPTFFISSEKAILNESEIQHFNLHAGQLEVSPTPWSSEPSGQVPTVLLTSGASCPDATVERVMERILSFYPGAKSAEEVWAQWSLA